MRNEQVLQRFFESGRVGKQSPKRDRFRISFWNREVEVIVDVAIEIEFALLDQLHHRGGGEQFRDRARAKQCLVRQHGLLRFEIGIAITLCEQDLSVFDYRDDGTGNVPGPQLRRNQCVEKSFEILFRERRRWTRLRSRAGNLRRRRGR